MTLDSKATNKACKYLELALETDDPSEKDYYIRQALQLYWYSADR